MALLASQPVSFLPSRHVGTVQVAVGLDAADRRIAQAVAPGDLAVTADLPLAADIVGQDAVALNPRGELRTAENVRERLGSG